MSFLLDLSLHGLIAYWLIYLLDRFAATYLSTRGRRWWWLVVPLAFLVSIPMPLLPPQATVAAPVSDAGKVFPPSLDLLSQSVPTRLNFVAGHVLFWLWLLGALLYLSLILVQTQRVLRGWSKERLCTDSVLLNLFEDCKQEAGITAPIGLVLSVQLSTPAILGWLRPRLLLPSNLLSSLSSTQLRAVLFHELAHFRSLDIPLNWLFSLVRTLHWFNPVAHLAFRSWARFREEAADETAMNWLQEKSGTTYGETLLYVLRHSHEQPAPFGALAIGESFHNLQQRITMINQYRNKPSRLFCVSAVLILLISGFIIRPVRAQDTSDPRPIAVAAMQVWLKEIDQNKYAQSWTEAADSFRQAVTSDQWMAALNQARQPLRRCTVRKLASSLHQTEVPNPAGPQKGDFVVAQFNTSFENLAYALETVTFEKASGGTWKAAGYYVHPQP